VSLPRETLLHTGPGNAILTNFGVWSPDGERIVFDRRNDALGERFDGTTIETVNVKTGEVRELYRSSGCGAATFFPDRDRVVFMVGPENPTPEWTYAATRRSGVMIDCDSPQHTIAFDARDVVAPYTPGALRGGSHVFAKHPTKPWVSYTYEDHICESSTTGEANRRTIALGILGKPVKPPRTHERNRDGTAYCVVTFPTVDPRTAKPGDVVRACEEAWIGDTNALAVIGDTASVNGSIVREAYRLDVPDDPTRVGFHPLQGTVERYPAPPAGIVATRLTHTEGEPHPGLSGPRHWLRSSADGSIGFLMKDGAGVPQFQVVSASGGPIRRLTHGPQSIESAFTWHPSRPWVAFVRAGIVTILDATTGETWPLTAPGPPAGTPLPLACVFSPTGDRIAFQRRHAGVNRISIVPVA